MPARMKLVALFLVTTILLTACRQVPEGGRGGTATPEATRPPAPSSTPTPQPTATANPRALHFSEIPEQTTIQGGAFLSLDLYGFLRYLRFPADRMTWNATGSEHVVVAVTDGLLTATLPDSAWTGSETILVEACDPDGTCAAGEVVYSVLNASAFSNVSVTYVANAGFLVTVGDQKVLVDVLFEGFPRVYAPPAYVQQALVNATPPFDGVDLILVTHAHDDHFTAQMVRQHMQNNPGAIFISTTQATSQLAEFGERVIAVDPREGAPVHAEANGIQVEAIYLSHGYPANSADEIFNNGYVVTLDGITFFHTGDLAEMQDILQYDLAEQDIDLAFIPHFYLQDGNSRSIVESGIAADYLFPIHYQFTTPEYDPARVLSNYPGAIIFGRELETWYMPLPMELPTPEPTATRTDSGEYVEFMTEDGLRLAGTFYPASGNTVVVFAHMGINDQTSWQGFAARLARRGMPALTFDFRCNGLSACDQGSNTSYYNIIDIQAATAFLRERGFQRIVCAGASMGAAACLNATLREEMAGLVFIAGPTSYALDGLSYPDSLINPGMPKLFIVAEQDRYSQVIAATNDLYAASPEPKQLITFPSTLHGTELFDSEYGDQFSQVLMEFLLSINERP